MEKAKSIIHQSQYSEISFSLLYQVELNHHRLEAGGGSIKLKHTIDSGQRLNDVGRCFLLI